MIILGINWEQNSSASLMIDGQIIGCSSEERFSGIIRDYTPEEVERLRGSIKIEHSMCKHQSTKLWKLLNSEPYINTLGSLSGNHAVQHAKAGLKAIYLSGWQVAADANSAGEMYPDQSLYPFDSAPKLVDAMNNALIRADQIQHMEIKDGDMQSKDRVDYMLPIIADGEAGFGGPLNDFELAKKFIKSGAAGVHFEDSQQVRRNVDTWEEKYWFQQAP